VEKHLTQNQVLGGRKSNRRSQRPRRAPAYVNWYINGYRRRWTSSDPNPTMRPDHGRIAGSCGVLPVTTDYMVDQLWGPRGALQRRAEVRTHENYREVFPLLSASFHGRSRGRCGPRERSPRSTRAPTKSSASSYPRSVQRLAATGRAKYVPDAAVTDGVHREATGTPSVTPRRWPRPVIPGHGPFLQRGGSRIRTLEGISRRIYSPLRVRSWARCTLRNPSAHPSPLTHGPRGATGFTPRSGPAIH
jgi:hypothetical protein